MGEVKGEEKGHLLGRGRGNLHLSRRYVSYEGEKTMRVDLRFGGKLEEKMLRISVYLK